MGFLCPLHDLVPLGKGFLCGRIHLSFTPLLVDAGYDTRRCAAVKLKRVISVRQFPTGTNDRGAAGLRDRRPARQRS